MEYKDHKVLQESLDRREIQARKDHRDHREQLVRKGLAEGRRVRKVFKGHKDHKV